MNDMDTADTRLNDRWWRLNNLYWIENKEGHLQRFQPNWAQTELYHALHTRNDILKVRQLGISTYTAILMLDYCLFYKNKCCGIIDKTLPDATSKLGKIRLAYEHLDFLPSDPTPDDISLATIGAMIKKAVPANISQTSITFGTGGQIRVGTSLRGGTFQLLHISELAYVAAHAPIRAREIVTGSINAVSKDSVVIRESTHEGGKYGLNYEMTKKSMEMVGKLLTSLDWKFFFFSWVNHPEYSLDEGSFPDDPDLLKYFGNLRDQHGIELTDGQKRWYAAQYRTFGPAIKQEYPTTPEEAFETQVEGAIYGKWITMLRSQGRLNAVYEVDDMAPLYVSWDIGLSDYMSLWLWQLKGDGRYYVVDCLQCNNKTLGWYVGKCREWEAQYGSIAKHLLPHDAAKRDWEGVSFDKKLYDAGFNVSIVPRATNIWHGIFAVRSILHHCVFHERCSRSQEIDGIEYISGVNALENYQLAPPGSNGTMRESPLHNICSHAADGFRTFAEAEAAGLVSSTPMGIEERATEHGSSSALALGAESLLI